jgi:hypothetical protein
VLTHPFPNDGPAGVAGKTSARWGGRDAWAFGFDQRLAVGVWLSPLLTLLDADRAAAHAGVKVSVAP